MRLTSLFAAVLAVLSASVLAAADGFAADSGNVEITAMWARATPPLTTTSAAYMEIKALGIADTLLGATTPVAERVEIHATTDSSGVMQMRPLKAVAIAPGKATSLAPTGIHLMLVGLNAPLKEGGSFPLKLRFELAGEVTVPVEIRKEVPLNEHLRH